MSPSWGNDAPESPIGSGRRAVATHIAGDSSVSSMSESPIDKNLFVFRNAVAHRNHRLSQTAIRTTSLTRAAIESNTGPLPVALPPSAVSTPSALSFAEVVAGSVSGGVIRYSVRAALFQEARRRNIPRFEANLIIAAVQHRVAGAKPGAGSKNLRGAQISRAAKAIGIVSPAGAGRPSVSCELSDSPSSDELSHDAGWSVSWKSFLPVFAIVEAALAIGIWCWLR
jgi:hypothetical protein